MSSSELKNFPRKTSSLSAKRIPDEVTLIAVANACAKFVNTVRGIRFVRSKVDDSRSVIIDFVTSKDCEAIKDDGLTINNIRYPLHFAHSKQTQNYTVTASEDKLYVKYPEDVKEDDVVKMLGKVSINKPENAKNFFFATCKDIDEQMRLIKALDRKPVGSGELSVKVAIDKTRKPRQPRAPTS
ncbi:hypothetical protein PAPHI01_1652 [Pancytospora philotis]|nr:hypothetical protein PAPHI01_1652 [Pancytospora philotis]